MVKLKIFLVQKSLIGLKLHETTKVCSINVMYRAAERFLSRCTFDRLVIYH